MPRKPTTIKDCEAIGAKLPLTPELTTKVLDAAGRSLDTDLENSVQTLQDGTSVCLHCGFPLPASMGRCPNCGRELKPADTQIIKKGTGIRYISVFCERKGALDRYVIQRQFTVDIRYVSGERSRITTDINEVYRNFVSSEGKVTSFRRGLNPFPYMCINPYNMGTNLKYRTPDYGYIPRYCDMAWDEAVNDLSGKMFRYMDRRRKKSSETLKELKKQFKQIQPS